MPRSPADTRVLIPASVMLQRLHDEVPADHFTLGWLMDGLHKRSFGITTLLLALVAIAPGASIVAGLLLMIPAFQMIAGMPAPVFPPTRECHYCWRDASAFAEAQVGLTRDLAASDSQMYSGLRLDWIAAAREMTAQKKDCNLRLGNKNKSIIVGTFIDWLCLLPVQYWTHDNW